MRNAAITALALFMIPMALANAITLYEDPETGQVFTKPAEGRVEMKYPAEIAETTAVPAASDTAKSETKSVVSDITILNPKSPEFPLGKETRVNMKFVAKDAPEMWLQAGIRVQGTAERAETNYADPTVMDTTQSDLYLRRARFEVAVGFGEHTSFKMDIRNDRVNQFFRDDGEFTLGDAYVQIKKPFDTSLVNFRIYRAKIDVARTETISSAKLITYDRPLVADYAAQYISFNRRGPNVQMYGNWKDKIHYQIASGDAIQPNALRDLIGSSIFDVSEQSLFYGGKLVLSPFNGWEETSKTETYMGQGKHFSFGAAYWTVPEIKGQVRTSGAAFDLNHQLINIEASAHYKGLFVQSEYFKFKDVVEDWSAPVVNTGNSNGWYVTSEYVMPSFYYIAPFARYETWDRFEGTPDNNVTSTLVGVNWYLRGNSTKVGLVYEKTRQDKTLSADGAADVNAIRITSQFWF